MCLTSPWLWKVKRPGVSVFLARLVILQQSPSVLQEIEVENYYLLPKDFHKLQRRQLDMNRLLQGGVSEVDVPSFSRGDHRNAHLHCGFVIDKPLSITGISRRVPLACHL